MDQDPAVNVNEEVQGKAREDNPVINPCSNQTVTLSSGIKQCLKWLWGLGVLSFPLDFWSGQIRGDSPG